LETAFGSSPINFDDAILAHAHWKTELATYLRKPDGTISASDLHADNKCKLGRWIHGEGAQYGALPEYAALKIAHANFHHIAADVVRKADRAQIANPNDVLELYGEFGAASSSVVNCIKMFWRKIS
jgi:hypothetical protein